MGAQRRVWLKDSRARLSPGSVDRYCDRPLAQSIRTCYIVVGIAAMQFAIICCHCFALQHLRRFVEPAASTMLKSCSNWLTPPTAWLAAQSFHKSPFTYNLSKRPNPAPGANEGRRQTICKDIYIHEYIYIYIYEGNPQARRSIMTISASKAPHYEKHI